MRSIPLYHIIIVSYVHLVKLNSHYTEISHPSFQLFEQYRKEFGSTIMRVKNNHNDRHNDYTSKHVYKGNNLQYRKKLYAKLFI